MMHQMDFFSDYYPVNICLDNSKNSTFSLSMPNKPKRARKKKWFETGETGVSKMITLLEEKTPYRVISTTLGMPVKIIADVAKKQGLQSAKSKAFYESRKKKSCFNLVEVFADKSVMKRKHKGFVLHVRGKDGKAILPHDNQCRRIFAYPIKLGGDFWCQQKRDKTHGKGLYCKTCHGEIYTIQKSTKSKNKSK